MRSYTGAPNSRVSSWYIVPGSRPACAVISAASKAGTMPSLSVVHTRAVAAQEGCTRAFLAAETDRAVEQPVDEPFETDRNLDEAASERGRHAIDHAAADDGLPDRARLWPALAMLEQVGNCDREIVIGIHQARAGVTMPWRSLSVSLANAMSKRSLMPTSRAIA